MPKVIEKEGGPSRFRQLFTVSNSMNTYVLLYMYIDLIL